MTSPTISSISPTAGHTGGKTLVDIVGTGFRVGAVPAASPLGPLPDPTPTVAVTFGGVPALKVWVYSDTLIRVLTPIHEACGIAQLDEHGDPVVPAAAVTVQNLDDAGAPIVGELATLPTAFSFVYPNLSRPGIMQRVFEAYILSLRLQVLPNVKTNPSTDYDPDSGDAGNFCDFTKLPGLAVVDIQTIKSREQTREKVVVQTSPTTFIERRPPVYRDIAMTLIGASDNLGELLTLEEVLDGFHQKNPQIVIPRDPDDPTVGDPLKFKMTYIGAGPVTYTGRIGNTNVQVFTAHVTILRIPRFDIPGLPTSSIAGTRDGDNAEATIAAGYTLDTVTTSAVRKDG